jgi:hypothetical protein
MRKSGDNKGKSSSFAVASTIPGPEPPTRWIPNGYDAAAGVFTTAVWPPKDGVTRAGGVCAITADGAGVKTRAFGMTGCGAEGTIGCCSSWTGVELSGDCGGTAGKSGVSPGKVCPRGPYGAALLSTLKGSDHLLGLLVEWFSDGERSKRSRRIYHRRFLTQWPLFLPSEKTCEGFTASATI